MTPLTILLVGGTGSIGRLVARRALADGHTVRVLTRRPASAPAGTEAVAGDLTDASTLAAAVEGIDAAVFTHGAPYQSPKVRDVDYGGVLNVLTAIGDRPVRIALMTAIGVTNRAGGYHDWKRRSERLPKPDFFLRVGLGSVVMAACWCWENVLWAKPSSDLLPSSPSGGGRGGPKGRSAGSRCSRATAVR